MQTEEGKLFEETAIAQLEERLRTTDYIWSFDGRDYKLVPTRTFVRAVRDAKYTKLRHYILTEGYGA